MIRNAPQLPDAKWHRPEPGYMRELLAKANLSQRAAARLLGVDERTMRYYASGQTPLPYPAQFCLEALADKSSGMVADAPREGGGWHQTKDRPIVAADKGRMVVGRSDESWLVGMIATDEWGPIIKRLGWNEIDGGTVSARILDVYMLLDPPTVRD